MSYFIKTTESFLKQLQFDADFYDVYSKEELLQHADYLLDACDITIKEGCDYWIDQNENEHYYCDLASEWAGSMIDIYHSDLWEKAPKFQCYIEEAINDFWFDKSRSLTDIFEMGQYLYYDWLAGYVLNQLTDYVKA